MSTLEALVALLFIMSAAALLVETVPRLDATIGSDVQVVVDAHGLGRSTGDVKAQGYARWWDCAEGKCT